MSAVLLVLATSEGGVGRHVAGLAQGLVGSGDRVTVAAAAAADRDFGFGAAGARFRRVEVAAAPRPVADLRAVLALRRLARDADVVHAHGLRAGAVAVLAVRSVPRHRPRVVVTVHNLPVGGGRVVAFGALLARIVARGADAVLAVSGDLAAVLRRYGARDVDLALVPAQTLNHAEVRVPPAVVRDRLGVGPGERLLVTVARLAPQKGLEVLADALALLGAARPDLRVRAVVAGGGPLGPALAADADRRQLPLTLLGRRGDVPDLLAAAELVVLPSSWEGQSLAVQEALRAGTALVATDVGGTALLTGDAAELVPPGDPAALARTLAALLDDPARAEDLRRRATNRGEALPGPAQAVAQVRALYARLAGRIGPGGGRPGD